MSKEESKKIIRMLLRGSRQIDRMRETINDVVRTVLGLVSPSCEWKKDRNSSLRLNDKFGWEILAVADGKLKVSFMFYPDDHSLAKRVVYYYYATSTISSGVQIEYVQMIYDNLDVFIDLMEENFPFLVQKWQPMLDAAKQMKDDPTSDLG